MSDQKITPHQGQGAKENNSQHNPSTLPDFVCTIPEDIRILRLVSALHDLYVYDNSGAEPLWSYDFLEIGACFEFLKHANLRQLQRALAEHNRREGGPVTLARVLPFPDGGEV
jgi:hypothetical protein